MKKFDVKEYSLIPPPFGGVSVYLVRLIRQLNHDGIKAGAYYSFDNNDSEIKESPLFDLFVWDKSVSRTRRFISHFKRMIKASSDYKIIHIHGHEVMILAAFVHLVRRQAIVITIHNAMIIETYSRFSYFKKQAFNYLARSDARWIAVSEQAKERLLALPVRFRHPIEVIPAYVPDTSEIQPLPKPLMDYLNHHKKIITFYGRSFMVFKGQDVYGFQTAIRMYSRLINYYNEAVGLVLCISDVSDSKSIEKLHRLALELHIDDAIFWQMGAIKEIRSLWRGTDLYIRPTVTDGDSVSIRDVLAEGAAVVASDVCQRPGGVVTYRYGDDDDFFNTCVNTLNKSRLAPNESFHYYNMIKGIYLSLMEENRL
jgi:hypothetical protein